MYLYRSMTKPCLLTLWFFSTCVWFVWIFWFFQCTGTCQWPFLDIYHNKKNQVIFKSLISYTNSRGKTLFLPLTQHTDLLLSFSPVKSINKSMILNPTNRVYHLVFQQFRNIFFYTVMYLLKFQVKVWEHFSASA